MRIAVYILLFANLAFFAWGAWIDAPPRVAGASSETHLPQLVLASESGAKAASGSPTQTRLARRRQLHVVFRWARSTLRNASKAQCPFCEGEALPHASVRKKGKSVMGSGST